MLTLRKRKTKTPKRKNKKQESPASGPQARDGLRKRTREILKENRERPKVGPKPKLA